MDEHRDARQELAWDRRRREPQEILNLRRGDKEGNAVGKPDRDRARNELHGCSQTSEAHQQEQNARHHADEREARRAKFQDDAGDDDDERTGGSADLSPRPAEGRNQEAGDHGGVQTSLRGDTRRDREGHRQGPRHETDRQPCDEILSKLSRCVAV